MQLFERKFKNINKHLKKNKLGRFEETIGLVDLQVNGFAGVDFNSPGLTPEKMQKSLEAILATGVLTFLPTIITESEKHMEICLSNLEFCRKSLPLADLMIPGYHLEGPFISKLKGFSGCHPIEHICKIDQEKFFRLQKAAGGKILLVTLAPELKGSIPLIEKLVKEDILVSIGHSNASKKIIHDAVSAGASLSTHLGNGTSLKILKNSNSIITQLAEDNLFASFIADGFHLPLEVLKVYLRAKEGKRVILITDATAAASVKPGRYTFGNIELILRSDSVVSDKFNNRPAGSTISLDQCVRNVINWYDVTLAEAVCWAAINPTNLLRKSKKFFIDKECEKKVWWLQEKGNWNVKKIQCGSFFYSSD